MSHFAQSNQAKPQFTSYEEDTHEECAVLRQSSKALGTNLSHTTVYVSKGCRVGTSWDVHLQARNNDCVDKLV